MEFRIADTLTASLARLPGQHQKAAKTTAFDLQVNPASPGLKFHKIDRSRDPNFWSVRVNQDIRLIVHKTGNSMLLCYVDHHEEAYRWAERRRIEAHPKTGAAQIVEVVERVRHEEKAEPKVDGEYAMFSATRVTMDRGLFDDFSDDELLGFGVPPDWLEAVRESKEDELLELATHLPQEAAEAVLDLAVGVRPTPPTPVPATTDPFAHPDAQRRFRVVSNLDELMLALEYPWEKWTVFLHPAQRQVAEKRFGGPARVTGSAGTGKTVVALHRAVHLARLSPDSRVLLATFSKSLAHALRLKLGRLLDPSDEATNHITVGYVDGIAHQLYEQTFGTKPNMASNVQVESAIAKVAEGLSEPRFGKRFLINEWRHVVDAWQLRTWEEYRDVSRLGRKTRIGGLQREALWDVFERTRKILAERNWVTWAEVVSRVTEHFRDAAEEPFTHAVIDEAQDVSIPQLRFLAAIVPSGEDSLFFAGDMGQRIFQQPYSWLSQGVNVRGRSFTLKVNYRTSHQIRRKADLLLPVHIRDVDGYEESRKGTVSVFNGPEPTIRKFETEDDEIAFVGDWIRSAVEDGIAPEEVGIFVRTVDQMGRAKQAVKRSGQKWITLQDRVEEVDGHIAIGTMHLAKGLEFKAVTVMACDDEVIPLQERIESAAEESELDEIFDTERHLLYVACTRARDQVAITGVEPGSEFLADLMT